MHFSMLWKCHWKHAQEEFRSCADSRPYVIHIITVTPRIREASDRVGSNFQRQHVPESCYPLLCTAANVAMLYLLMNIYRYQTFNHHKELYAFALNYFSYNVYICQSWSRWLHCFDTLCSENNETLYSLFVKRK